MPRGKCFDIRINKKKGDHAELALVPCTRTFHELWKGAAKTALFAQENHDFAPETRYELYGIAGVEAPSYKDVAKMTILCPECGTPMKRVSPPSMSNPVILDHGEYRCPKCFIKCWDAERQRRKEELARRERMGVV